MSGPYNEICNDECNIPEFSFDGGDCCLPDMGLVFHLCDECKCISDSSITL